MTVYGRHVTAAPHRLPLAAVFFDPCPHHFGFTLAFSLFIEFLSIRRTACHLLLLEFTLCAFFAVLPSPHSPIHAPKPPITPCPHPVSVRPKLRKPSLSDHQPTNHHHRNSPLASLLSHNALCSTRLVYSSKRACLHLTASFFFAIKTHLLFFLQCPRHSLRVLLPPPLATSTTLTKEVMEPPVENGMPYFFALL